MIEIGYFTWHIFTFLCSLVMTKLIQSAPLQINVGNYLQFIYPETKLSVPILVVNTDKVSILTY